jgi:hypothetical protein
LEDPDNFKFKTLELPLLGDQEMRLFGKKRHLQSKRLPTRFSVVSRLPKRLLVTKSSRGSPNLTVVTVRSPPVIDENVETKREGNKIYVLSKECKLRITVKEGSMEAKISKL